MTHHQTPSDRTRSAILSYVSQSELRGVHNFASATQQTAPLDLATTPTPWSQTPIPNEPFISAEAGPVPASNRPAATLDLTRARTPGPNTVAETDFVFESRLTEDDPPFRAPESWRSPSNTAQDEQPWNHLIQNWSWPNWSWNERSTAAFLGFAAGILFVVPMVLLLSTTSGQQPVPAQEATTKQLITQTETSPVVFASANISAGAWVNTQATQSPRSQEQPAQSIEIVSQAHQAMTEGRIDQARTLLRAAASPDAPQLWFMLAETYDPLVSTQTPSATSNSQQLAAADTNFARFYYQQALTHGVSRARARLDGLTKP